VSEKYLSLIDHLKELRKRLFFSLFAIVLTSILSYTCFDFIIAALSKPFDSVSSLYENKLYIHSILEGFVIKIKYAILIGILAALPIILYQALRFALPGLKKKEKLVVFSALFSGIILASISFYMGYFKLLPYSIQFLSSTHFIPKDVGILLNYQVNLSFVTYLLFGMMVIFQFPIGIGILLYLNILSRKSLLKMGRFYIIGIFVCSALITPPDIVTQLSLAIPLIALFYGTILLAKCFGWGKKDV